MIYQCKSNLRQQCLKNRNNITLDERDTAENQIFSQLIHLPAFRTAKTIGLYAAINNEVPLNKLWHYACKENKRCYFATLTEDRRLLFLPADLATHWQQNIYGIPEPITAPVASIPINELDLIIAPLLAFDLHGTRLGMGGGYYDRTLATERPKLYIGVGYAFQQQSVIRPDLWDVPLQAIITPEGLYWSSRD